MLHPWLEPGSPSAAATVPRVKGAVGTVAIKNVIFMLKSLNSDTGLGHSCLSGVARAVAAGCAR
jgi:hypothetical protein